MFGIKKMLKDEEATGIIGAICAGLPACLPSSVWGGGIGAIVTLVMMLLGFLGSGCGIPALWSIVSLPCCFGCTTGCCTGAWTLAAWGGACSCALIMDAFIATCVGGITSCVAACGASVGNIITGAACCVPILPCLADYYIACIAPIATVCLTPAIGVLAAAVSAICGAFGCSLGTGIGTLSMLFGTLGKNIGAIVGAM